VNRCGCRDRILNLHLAKMNGVGSNGRTVALLEGVGNDLGRCQDSASSAEVFVSSGSRDVVNARVIVIWNDFVG